MGKYQEAWEAVGGLSKPSKMPCYGYSLPASRCITGSKLAKIHGTICEQCYALKGRYHFDRIQKVLENRYQKMIANYDAWVNNMVFLIKENLKRKQKGFDPSYFRWHDSGDLQSLEHFQSIIRIANRVPEVKFWLPTREYAIVEWGIQTHAVLPTNLTIRWSFSKVDTPIMPVAIPTSGVHTKGNAVGWECPAPTQGHKCQQCRACWNPTVQHVSYLVH